MSCLYRGRKCKKLLHGSVHVCHSFSAAMDPEKLQNPADRTCVLCLVPHRSFSTSTQPSPPLFYSFKLVFVIIAMILSSLTSSAEKNGSAFADTSENSKCGGLLLGPQEDHDAEIEMADTEPPALVPVSFTSMFRYLQSLPHTTRLLTAV